MPDPTRTAIGTWSGGRFMHFGEPLDDERLIALLRPDERVRTVITADAYGAGEADALLGRALEGVERGSYCLVGAVGHDFYEGEREGSKGFPASPTRACAARRTTPATCAWRPSARSSGSARTRSTCCCSITPTGPATPARRCGRAWRRCATPA